MKRLLIAALAIACAGLVMPMLDNDSAQSTALAQDKKEEVEKITNIETHLKGDEAYQKAAFGDRLDIVAALLKDKRINWSQARGAHMRELMAHAKANDIDPAKNLVGWVQWAGVELKNYQGQIRKACGNTGALDAMMETYGAQRLYRDETFTKGDAIAKLGRIKELWEARELGQSQCYELTAMYIYEHLAAANGDIDKQIEMFGKLTRAKCMDWAGSASVHDALLTRALETKKDLDTVEKKLAWITKHTHSTDGDLSWMVVGRRRLTLFIHAMDSTLAGLSLEEREAKIDEYEKQNLIEHSDLRDLKATYCEVK